jgi:tetratricopeptide (TPR) repeat protein
MTNINPTASLKRLKASLCVALMVSSAVAPAAPPQTGGNQVSSVPQVSAVKELLLSKARSLEGRGRLDLAAQTWKQILLIEPNQPDALAGLARYAKQRGKVDESSRLLDQLKQVNPASGAIKQVESTVVMDSQRQRLEQASKFARNGQPREAMAIYNEVFGGNPPPGGWAIAYHETDAATPGGWERATAALQSLMQQYPNAVEYKVSLGTLYTYRPESRLNGIRLLESVSTANIQYNKARQAWRQALVWEGSNPTVASSLRTYLTRHSDSELARNLSAMPATPERADRNLQNTPEEQAAFDDLNKGQTLLAESKFEAVLKQHPNSPGALAGMGFVRMKQEEFTAALQYLEKAQALQPGVASIQEAVETSRFFRALREGTRFLAADKIADASDRFQLATRLRPKNAAAQRGLAGVYLKSGKAKEAASIFEKMIALEPNDLENWRGWINARYQAEGAKAAVAAAQSAPPLVQTDLQKSAEFLGLMASATAELGQSKESSSYVERAMAIARANNMALPNTLLLQVAGTNLNQGNYAKASELYQSVIRSEPYNLVAYEGLIATFLQQKEEKAAFEVIEKMPSDLYQSALKRPGFLRSSAFVQARFGRAEQAEQLLSEMIRMDGPDKVSVDVQLQLADIWLQQGRAADSERLIRELLAKHSDDANVWRSLLLSLRKRNLNETALIEASRMPALVAGKLNADPEHLSLIAGIQNDLGNATEAIKLGDMALKIYDARKADPPADLLLQQAWILLNGKAEERQLYAALNRISFYRNLNAKQEESYGQIWSIWARRRAEEARQAGETAKAIQILEAASRVLPKDTSLKSTIAGTYLVNGEPKKAVAVYKAWNLVNATDADYAGAVGAATGENNSLAQKWLQEGLKKFPNSPRLHNLAGQLAMQRGDFKRAELNYRAALALAGNKETSKFADGNFDVTATDKNDPRRSLARILLNDTDAPGANPPEGTVVATNGEDMVRAINGEAPIKGGNAFVDGAAKKSEYDEIADRLQSLESRNTPYVSIEGGVSNRNGNAGFENRMLQETTMTSSVVLADAFRVSLIARPTVIQTGAQDGRTDILRLGLAPQGTAFGSQSQSGLAAELQISTSNFGIRAGLSPQGFLVKNYIGGLRFRPGGGPITLTVDRDNIKDSMLSFAGVRDSVTKQVFGGVVGNRFGVGGNWGTARRGIYASGGFQTITGQQVQSNRRVDGGGGVYYQILSLKQGTLTTGLNLFMMSYERNLRYFTIGHGGYFSPQMFYLVNVPLQWSGVYQRRFEYSVNVSLGSQSFREDAAPYFPTLLNVQGLNGPFYNSQNVSGASYSLDFKGLYQLNPNWFIGTFVNLNNARNFQSQSAGFALKYAFKAKPMGSAFTSTTIPDWKGMQPFNAN